MKKRPAPAATDQMHKTHKVEHQPPSQDFSNSVKKKLSNSTRTGQACDRCKIRKIRCDGRPGGCSPCAQNNTLCKTTDRITGRATTRGHTEHLEAENDYLRRIIGDLQAQLREAGQEVKPFAPFPTYVSSAPQPQSIAWPQNDVPAGPTQGANYLSQSYQFDDTVREGSVSSQLDSIAGGLPTFKTGCTGDNYLGVSSADSILSPIKGTSLSFFGTELNLTDFVPADPEDENAPTSYQTFLRVAFGQIKPAKVDFPTYKELHEYASWYFRSLHPYAPMLHRPTVMRILYNIGNDPDFKPTAAQTVIVHMLLASIKYQISTRNAQPQFLDEAHKHYHYSISHTPDLLLSHSLEDIQALALICLHLRNFPKPGAAWLVTQLSFSVVVESGLHRSSKAWAETSPKPAEHEVEVRKRVFWVIYNLLIGLSGRLGRPMPMRLEDMDVEYPVAENDMEGREGEKVVNFHDCTFQIGLCTPKLALIISKMYSTIYAIRQSPQNYERTVRTLDEELTVWRNGLPPEFSLDSQAADHENYIFVRYIHTWEHDTRLLLHHPALCRSQDPEFVEYNMTSCLKAAKNLVRTVSELRKYKSLDIPWVNVTVYLAAIFTTLYIHAQYKQEVTAEELSDLRTDMDLWTEVLVDIGEIYGTGGRLPSAVRKIIDQCLDAISSRMAQRTASAAVARTASISQPPPPEKSREPVYHENYAPAQPVAPTIVDAKPPPFLSSPEGSSLSHQQEPYAQVAYNQQPEPQVSYPLSSNLESSAYNGSMPARASISDEDRALQAALEASTSPHRRGSESMYAMHAPAMPHHVTTSRANYTSAWQEWTRQNVVGNLITPSVNPYAPTPTSAPHHPHLNSANALMELGGATGRRSSAPIAPTNSLGPGMPIHSGPPGVVSQPSHPLMNSHTQWPEMIFHQHHKP